MEQQALAHCLALLNEALHLTHALGEHVYEMKQYWESQEPSAQAA